ARQVRAAVGDAPYLVKIGHVPSRADAQRLVAAVGEHVDGLAMTNSIATTVRGANGLMFDGGRRGICGAAILDESLRQVERFRDAIERQGAAVDIVGVGGIGEADHVKRFLSAGAVATHLATAAMLDPAIARRIRREWSALAVKGAVKG
ncbi:MAG: hypothetical protein QGG36_05500, partial [Pirellulaceae bacterium]|nr:hypothetical protein [Pirellulaceae bacterium]